MSYEDFENIFFTSQIISMSNKFYIFSILLYINTKFLRIDWEV